MDVSRFIFSITRPICDLFDNVRAVWTHFKKFAVLHMSRDYMYMQVRPCLHSHGGGDTARGSKSVLSINRVSLLLGYA